MKDTSTVRIGFSKELEINFEGGEMSGETGMLLMHEFCHAMGVEGLLRKHVPEERGGTYQHHKPDILYQEIIRIIGGYASNNAASYLQKDPIFRQIHKGKIASSSTCCRLEKIFAISDMKNLQKAQEELLERAYEIEAPREMIFDLDTTYDPASSSLHGSNYNTHYGETGFSPLLCFDGITGDLIKGDLRPGTTYCSKKVVPFLSPVLKKFSSREIPLFARADSGFASPEIYELLEKYGVQYSIKLKMNSLLKTPFQEKIAEEESPETFDSLRNTEKEIFFSFSYAAKSWKKERRIIARIQWKKGLLFPLCSAIVTNDHQISPENGFSFYNGRASLENRIEEGKNGFSWDHISHKSFNHNRVKFQVFLASFLITNLFRRFCVPAQKEKSTIESLRILFFKLASRFVKGSRKIVIKCSSSFPFQNLWIKTLHNIHLISLLFNFSSPDSS